MVLTAPAFVIYFAPPPMHACYIFLNNLRQTETTVATDGSARTNATSNQRDEKCRIISPIFSYFFFFFFSSAHPSCIWKNLLIQVLAAINRLLSPERVAKKCSWYMCRSRCEPAGKHDISRYRSCWSAHAEVERQSGRGWWKTTKSHCP